MADYIRISLEGIQQEQRDILLAQLSEAGFEGFEEGVDYLHAFISAVEYNRDGLTSLLGPIAFREERIPEQNWNTQWEQQFQPVRVGNFCYIRARFHAPVHDVLYDILIMPKMSFGTGHHATTFLMIQLMQDMDLQGKSVLDFGTGTGILAILAQKMGASEVLAIDNDDWSIANAKENIMENNCSSILVEKTDCLNISRKFEFLTANINRNVLLANMGEIEQHLAPGGVVLMSGLLTGDRKEIEKAASNNQLRIVKQLEKDGWMALVLERQ